MESWTLKSSGRSLTKRAFELIIYIYDTKRNKCDTSKQAGTAKGWTRAECDQKKLYMNEENCTVRSLQI